MNLIDICGTLQPNAAEYRLFSVAHGTFSRIDHMLGHKTSLSKFKKIEIISYHNDMRLEINYKKKKAAKNTNVWRLNNMLLNNKLLTEEIKEEIKTYMKTNENGNTMVQNL